MGMMGRSIWGARTTNKALFVKNELSAKGWSIHSGLRIDKTDVSTKRPAMPSRTFDEVSLYTLIDYALNKHFTIVGSLGKSHRVPDGKELYFVNMGKFIGNPNLNAVINQEIDFGFLYEDERSRVQATLFYSILFDNILYNATIKRYENVDSRLYGFDLDASYMASEKLLLDLGLSYQRGKKDRPLIGQSDRDLPDVPPLKLALMANYFYSDKLTLKASAVAASKWTRFDADGGEQEIDGYGVLNLKGEYQYSDNLSVTVGVDNLLDEAYAVSNTYKDLTLTSGGGEVMLL